MRYEKIRLMIVLFAILSSSNTYGVEIRANDAHVDFSTGTSIYTGNVRIDDNELHLEAAQVTEYRKGSKTTLIVATGSPVRFRQEPIVEATFSHGEAERIEYHAQSRELKLEEFTVTDTQGNVQRGKAVTYKLPE